jgi:hypothetical protein
MADSSGQEKYEPTYGLINTFPVSAAPNSASIIISPAHTWTSIPAKMAWREDTRRDPNGTQLSAAGCLAAGHPPSPRWTGYWQRHHRKALDQAA